MSQPLRQHGAASAVPHAASAQFVDHLGDQVCADPPLVGPPRHHQRCCGSLQVAPEGLVQHLSHPGVTLDQCRGNAVQPTDSHAVGLAHQ